MDEYIYAIEAGITRDRKEFEDLSSSPPSVEDGFVHFRYRQKEAQAPKKERRPSLYEFLTQDGGALRSLIGGDSTDSNTSRPPERKISRGGTISFDQFGEFDFDDFEEVSSRAPPKSLVAPLVSPAFETLDHSDALNKNQASNLTGDSTIKKQANRYADEALDDAHFQYAQKPPKSVRQRKSSVILDKVTSLNINAQQFGNENENSHKRKISSITNPIFTLEDIDITKQEHIDEKCNKLSRQRSVSESVDTFGLPNIQDQTAIFYGRRASLELRNAQVHSTVIQNESDDAADKQLVRKTSLIHQDEDPAPVSKQAFEPFKPESSKAPDLERKISTSMLNFFTGMLDKPSRSLSIEDKVQDGVESDGNIQLVRKTSNIHQDVDTDVSQSAIEPTRPESSKADGDNQLARKTSNIHQVVDTDVSQSDYEPIIPESSKVPILERKISTSMLNFFTGMLDKPSKSLSIEDKMQDEEDNDGNNQLVRKTSFIHQDVDTDVSRSAIEPARPESSKADGDNQLVRKTSNIHQDVYTDVSRSAIEPIKPESSEAPILERKISTSIMNFVTGVLDKATAGSSVERAQEVKEINEVNMLFRY